MHGGDPLIEGTRYIIAAFLLLEEGRDGDGDDYDQTNDGKGDGETAGGHQQQSPKQEGTHQQQPQSQSQPQQQPRQQPQPPQPRQAEPQPLHPEQQQQQQQQEINDDEDDTLLLGRILQTHTSLSHLRPTRGKDRGRGRGIHSFIVYYLSYPILHLGTPIL